MTLPPAVAFSGVPSPTDADLDAVHREAHDRCFIANSVRTEVRCEPTRPSR